MAELTYVLCAVLSASCAFLLFRQQRAGATPLIFWTGLCFAGLAANNAFLVADLVVFPTSIDLAVVRSAVALASVAVLLFGFIWNAP
jgi:hypothetical protein